MTSMYRILCKKRLISFPNELFHFGLSGPFIRCMYSWGFSVSGHIIAFIRPIWIVTSPVVFFVCAQSSPDFWTEYVWTALLGGLSGCTVDMWLTISYWPCILFSIVLYMCTGGMLPDFHCMGASVVRVSQCHLG